MRIRCQPEGRGRATAGADGPRGLPARGRGRGSRDCCGPRGWRAAARRRGEQWAWPAGRGPERRGAPSRPRPPRPRQLGLRPAGVAGPAGCGREGLRFLRGRPQPASRPGVALTCDSDGLPSRRVSPSDPNPKLDWRPGPERLGFPDFGYLGCCRPGYLTGGRHHHPVNIFH